MIKRLVLMSTYGRGLILSNITNSVMILYRMVRDFTCVEIDSTPLSKKHLSYKHAIPMPLRRQKHSSAVESESPYDMLISS